MRFLKISSIFALMSILFCNCKFFSGPQDGWLSQVGEVDLHFAQIPDVGDTTRFVWDITFDEGNTGQSFDSLYAWIFFMNTAPSTNVVGVNADSLWYGQIITGQLVQIEAYLSPDSAEHYCCNDPDFAACHRLELSAIISEHADLTQALKDSLFGVTRTHTFMTFQFNHKSGKYILETGYDYITGQGSRP